jgi:hypothetical protein
MKKEHLKHDLNNSLNRIKIMIELLDKKNFQELQKEEIIEDGKIEIENLSKLFLDFCNSEALR